MLSLLFKFVFEKRIAVHKIFAASNFSYFSVVFWDAKIRFAQRSFSRNFQVKNDKSQNLNCKIKLLTKKFERSKMSCPTVDANLNFRRNSGIPQLQYKQNTQFNQSLAYMQFRYEGCVVTKKPTPIKQFLIIFYIF
eukprot:TRINITY_DN3900_c2_g1_i9.p3 TRINITY_DN3900_c2_g1~~TRINITY_DN3900_c2_g1_i9.p3  ORF type:complete len:136 (-),score=1.94 TRINITY_DN3900_c2_g1_i9:185-592(-)